MTELIQAIFSTTTQPLRTWFFKLKKRHRMALGWFKKKKQVEDETPETADEQAGPEAAPAELKKEAVETEAVDAVATTAESRSQTNGIL